MKLFGRSEAKIPPSDWPNRALERLMFATLREQRAKRRWGLFFKLILLAYVLFITVFFLLPDLPSAQMTEPSTAVVEVKGLIVPGSDYSADNIITGLQRAFKLPHVRGVVVRINSPGGSAVQSGQVYDEIKRLKALHENIPLYAVIDDVGASGAYYIASAADQIYANKASLVGSIGVLLGGFGFTEMMDKLGVDRRLYTAGDNKNFLDPFSPVNPKHLEHADKLLNTAHQQFVDAVRAGRGERLVEHPDIFSGLIWSGEQALAYGLIDGFATVDQVATEMFEAPQTMDMTQTGTVLERLSKQLSAQLLQGAVSMATRMNFSVH